MLGYQSLGAAHLPSPPAKRGQKKRLGSPTGFAEHS